jgi:GAF domain-containing protein
MQRRGESEQPVKGRRNRATRPKTRKAPTAHLSTDHSPEQFDCLKRERDEAREQLAATTEILRVIRASPTDAQPVFETIVRNAVSLCGSLFANVFRFDGELLHFGATSGGQDYADLIRERYPMCPDSSQISGRVLLTKSVVWLEDALTDPDYDKRYPLALGWRRVLGVPMLRGSDPIGVIVVAWAEPGPPSMGQEELLKTFADQAVIAIENVRLFEAEQQRTRELSESLEQQTATSEVLKVISSSPGKLEPVFDAMLANATRICEAKFGTLYLRDGDGFRAVAATRDAPPAYVEARKSAQRLQPSPDGPVGRAASTKQVVHIDDLSKLQSYLDHRAVIVDAVELGGFRTALGVPMLKDDELIGVITILRQEVRPFTDKQIELVKNFAAQAVIAIENTRLLNELRESLQQQTATADVLKVISSSPGELEPVFKAMLANAVRICEANFGMLFRAENGAMSAAAMLGVPPAFAEFWQRGPQRPGPRTAFGRTVETRRAVHVVDVRTDPAYVEGEPVFVAAVKLGGFRTILNVPMLKDNEVIGVFAIYRQEVRAFTDKQIELVKSFAAQAVIAIENTRLLNELRESLQQQTATADVLNVISSSPGELEPVFQEMLSNAMRICEAKFGILFEFADGAFRALSSFNLPPAFAKFHKEARVWGPDSGLGRLASTKKTIHVKDTQEGRAFAERDAGRMAAVELGAVRTFVAVPMLKENELVGAFVIFRQEVRPFTDKQIELVSNFAAQAVIAIENARLLNELRESLQQQTATADVLKVISSSPGDLEPVFQAMLEKATLICEAKFGVMFLHENGFFRTRAMCGVPPALAEERHRNPLIRPSPGTGVGRVLRSKKTVHITDVLMEPEYLNVPEGFTKPGIVQFHGARTELAVPMLKDDELVGTIVIYRTEVRPFTGKQIELVTNFAAQAVIAIENTRLLSELRTRTNELAQSVEELQALGEVSQAVNSTLDLETVLTTIVRRAVELSRTDAGAIYVFNEQHEEFRLHATHGMSETMIAAIGSQHIGLGDGNNIATATTERKPVQVADTRDEPPSAVNDIVLREGYRSILVIPLLRPDHIVGALVVRRKTPGNFPQTAIELLQTFADQSVVAIQNARLYENVETRTRQLAQSLDDLRTTQDRLVQTQKLASLGQLTAGIAHEIKNPLNFVNNFSGVSAELLAELQETLADVSLGEKRRSEIAELMDTLRGNFDKIVQHGKRADAIVKNMLLHSREGSGEHRSVDINALVEESLNLAYHGARAEKQGFNITLERSFDPAAEQADVFPQDITRVLLNLILNGFYAATQRKAEARIDDHEPILVVATRNLGDRVEITVRDNGTGIPLEIKDKIFNPFFTTKPAGEGTGLGLSISHDIIVKQHGGSIEVETEPGEYTEFRIILPRAAAFATTSGAQS